VIYRLHPEAAAEHLKQVAYYEGKRAGLGKRYHKEFRAVLAVACEAPHRYRVVYPQGIRRVGFAVFPFDLIYREVDGVVQVLAVAAHRRIPSYWVSRLQQ
jgi:plasmid stabilization system protein ParE